MRYFSFRTFLRMGGLLLALVGLSAAHAQATPCPAVTERAEEIMASFERESVTPEFKAEVGLGGFGPGDARALGAATDTAEDRDACGALNAELREAIDRRVAGRPLNAFSYYAVGEGRYLVVRNLIQVEGHFTVGTSSIYAFSWSSGALVYLGGIAF